MEDDYSSSSGSEGYYDEEEDPDGSKSRIKDEIADIDKEIEDL